MALQECRLDLTMDNKELAAHGTVAFPCEGYAHRYTDKPEDVIPWHWHEGLEIVYLKSGKMKWKLPNEKLYLKEGEAAVINSNVLHYAVADPVCELHSMVFSPLLVGGSVESVFSVKYMGPLTSCGLFEAERLGVTARNHFIKAFDSLAQEASNYEFTVREELSNICLELYKKYQHVIEDASEEGGEDAARIRKMLDYIHNHYGEKITLDQIARTADIGKRECLRCFQRVIQTSPIQYLLNYRINQGASMLLRNQGCSISEISGQCGFESAGNFAQVFKKNFGCTPREYRKKDISYRQR